MNLQFLLIIAFIAITLDGCAPKPKVKPIPTPKLDFPLCPSWKGKLGIPNHINRKVAKDDRRKLIIDGGRADTSEYPWQVWFPIGCGGTIISRHWIVTAAHCPLKIGMTVYAANRRWTSEIAQIINHGRFDPPRYNMGNDIALVKIRGIFPCGNKHIRAIQLLEGDFNVDECHATVTGFGKVEYGILGNPTNYLNELHTKVFSMATCKRMAPLFEGYPKEHLTWAPTQICGHTHGNPSESSCNGDSGGPLVIDINTGGHHEYILTGLVSWGFHCGGSSPVFYENIAKHTDFIRRHVEHTVFKRVNKCDKSFHEEGRIGRKVHKEPKRTTLYAGVCAKSHGASPKPFFQKRFYMMSLAPQKHFLACRMECVKHRRRCKAFQLIEFGTVSDCALFDDVGINMGKGSGATCSVVNQDSNFYNTATSRRKF